MAQDYAETSVIALVAILQRHGLTVETLEDMVHFCERRCTGSLVLHVVEGELLLFEDHSKRALKPPTVLRQQRKSL